MTHDEVAGLPHAVSPKLRLCPQGCVDYPVRVKSRPVTSECIGTGGRKS